MKIIFSFLLFTTLVLPSFSQSRNGLEFTDYGPVAFDGFWRIPTLNPGYNQFTFSTASRVTNDFRSGTYFTQYLRMDIPIGAGNGLSVRMPFHQFNVPTTTANQLDMANAKGSEWGDLEFIFTINAFPQFFDRWAGGKYSLQFIGEMHTAPTSRANRQFTDTLKMLGLMGFKGTWNLGSGTLTGATFIGVGGWQDDERPRQNHVFKFSPAVRYQLPISTKWKIGTSLGATYLAGEKSNDEGLFWNTGLFVEDSKARRLTLNYGNIRYTEQVKGHVNQWEMGIVLPIWFTGFQSVEAFRQ